MPPNAGGIDRQLGARRAIRPLAELGFAKLRDPYIHDQIAVIVTPVWAG
jgi:hypothetical protein